MLLKEGWDSKSGRGKELAPAAAATWLVRQPGFLYMRLVSLLGVVFSLHLPPTFLPKAELSEAVNFMARSTKKGEFCGV